MHCFSLYESYNGLDNHSGGANLLMQLKHFIF